MLIAQNFTEAMRELDDELNIWSRMGHRPCLWWRDDDAKRDSMELQSLRRLLDTEYLFLAVVPGLLSDDLVRMIEPEARVYVLQHGWMHTNHSALGKNASEFPRQRAKDDVANELWAGQLILSNAFSGKFHRVFVPPWHRCADWILRDLEQLGFVGVSLESPPFPLVTHGYLGEINIEIDLCDWTRNGSFIGNERLADLLVRALKLRRHWCHQQAPLGILSHHALLTSYDLRSLSTILDLLRAHDADWVDPLRLFSLAACLQDKLITQIGLNTPNGFQLGWPEARVGQ